MISIERIVVVAFQPDFSFQLRMSRKFSLTHSFPGHHSNTMATGMHQHAAMYTISLTLGHESSICTTDLVLREFEIFPWRLESGVPILDSQPNVTAAARCISFVAD